MRIKNTSDIPTEKIHEMIEFVRPKRIGHVTVYLKNKEKKVYYGSTNTTNRVELSITKDENRFPYFNDYSIHYFIRYKDPKTGCVELKPSNKKTGRRGGYIDNLMLSRDECLVHLLAHELRHIWQTYHTGRRGKVKYARGNHSERDADAYAIKMQRKWRKIHNIPDYSNIPSFFNLMCSF